MRLLIAGKDKARAEHVLAHIKRVRPKAAQLLPHVVDSVRYVGPELLSRDSSFCEHLGGMKHRLLMQPGFDTTTLLHELGHAVSIVARVADEPWVTVEQLGLADPGLTYTAERAADVFVSYCGYEKPLFSESADRKDHNPLFGMPVGKEEWNHLETVIVDSLRLID